MRIQWQFSKKSGIILSRLGHWPYVSFLHKACRSKLPLRFKLMIKPFMLTVYIGGERMSQMIGWFKTLPLQIWRLWHRLWVRIKWRRILSDRPPSIRQIAKWHIKCELDMSCPFCEAGNNDVKKNSSGFYRCRECNVRWFLMKADDY